MTLQIDVPLLSRFRAPMEMAAVEVAAPEAGEVLVRMVASGVCQSCLGSAEGEHGDLPLPMILGDEGAGVVENVGEGVRDLVPGDHVVLSWAPGCRVCRFCAAGRPQLCVRQPPFGVMRDGTTRFSAGDTPVHHYGPSSYAAYTVVSDLAAVKVRNDVPLEVAALVGCSVTTGVGAVTHAAAARPGDRIAVFGCGGIGLNSIQGAHLISAQQIIAVDPVREKLRLAEQLGATNTVDPMATDVVEEVRSISQGGVDHAIVAVGSTTVVEQAFASLGPGGTCVVLGIAPEGHTASVSGRAIEAGALRIVGAMYGEMTPHVDFPRLLDLYAVGKLALDELVTQRWQVDQANEAFDALKAGEVARGLIVF